MVEAPKKQCVWIIRYGLTKTALVEGVGPYDSDIHPEDGVEAANCIGTRLNSCQSDSPSIIYSSPFLRTTHTADIISKGLDQTPPVCIEEGVTEWLTPSLIVDPAGTQTKPRTVEQLRNLFDSIDGSYISLNPVVEDDQGDRNGAPCFIESEAALLVRAKATISKLLEHSDGKNFAIVSHAPCIQAMAFALEGAASPSESKLGPWPLGGVTKFSRCEDEKEWKLEIYGDTNHMPGIYKPGIKHWSLPCFQSR